MSTHIAKHILVTHDNGFECEYMINLTVSTLPKSKWEGYVYCNDGHCNNGEFIQMFDRNGGALRMTFKRLIRKVSRDNPTAISIVADYDRIK